MKVFLDVGAYMPTYAHDDAQDATTGVYENLPKKKESNYTPIFM